MGDSTELQRVGQSRSTVFSQVSWQKSALGLACTMYPTGCQLSLRKTERWRIENERGWGGGWGGGVKGVVMMWGHEPRGFLSLLLLICLSDDNKKNKHGSSKRREGDVRGGNNAEGKERDGEGDTERGTWLPHFSRWWKFFQMGHNTVILNALVQMSTPQGFPTTLTIYKKCGVLCMRWIALFAEGYGFTHSLLQYSLQCPSN